MKKLSNPDRINVAIKTIAVSGMAALGGMTSAATLNISDTPLFLESTVQSNIYFVIDDSGSMEWEYVITAGGSAEYGLSSASVTRYVDLDSRSQVLGACLGVNALAYNPDKTYTPWAGEDDQGNEYADQSVTAAIVNPYFASNPSYEDLTRYNTTYYQFGGYMPWYDHDSDDYADLWVDVNGNGEMDIWLDENDNNVFDGFVDYDGNGEFTPLEDADGDGKLDYVEGKYEFESELECPDENEIWDLFTSSSQINAFLKNWMVVMKEQDADVQQNFANWYSYYRSRDFVTKKALSEIITDSAARVGFDTINDNEYYNIVDVDNISLPVDETADVNKDKLLDELLSIDPSGYTPLRSALARSGNYFDTGDAILSEDEGGSCQQNFTILMTDGYANGSYSSSSVANADGDGDSDWDGGGYADTYSNTLADIAMYYYETDLEPDLDPNVPKTEKIDENGDQHIVTYTVAFGVTGSIDAEALYEAYDNLTTAEAEEYDDFADYLDDTDASGFDGWPSRDGNSGKIDDMFHAAVNGRGLFLNAQDPDELIDSLNDAIGDIEGRNAAASAVSVNTGSITSSSMLFTASFNAEEWVGRVYGIPINTDGSLNTEGKAVASIIPSHGSRNIITWNTSTDAGVPFQWGINETGISSDQRLLFNDNEDLLEYIRGDESEEGEQFRERGEWTSDDTGNYLGDIINSAPAYVANPQYLYPDDLENHAYSDFRTNPDGDLTNDDDFDDGSGVVFYRPPMIYVGANDGMLHAFKVYPDTSRTDFGEEVFAYAPSMLFKNLDFLADGDTYSHAYYVDGSPYVGDAYFDSAWHSVLVSGLGAGGQGIFALDITDPDSFAGTESAAAENVLWEFSDSNDQDLGFTYSKPIIVKANNDKWVAIFGNGYNNTEDDTAEGGVIGGGTPVLYVLDVETGELLSKIDTGVNDLTIPNGLSSPVTLDTEGDYKADYVYAGDLEGNVWKFDLTSSDPDQWDVAYTDGDENLPLYTACITADCEDTDRQSITVKPKIGFNKGATGYQLYFGTGTYFMASDNESTGIQTFYSIWDKMLTNDEFVDLRDMDRSHLLQQEITEEKSPDDGDLDAMGNLIVDKQRITTANSIYWHTEDGLPTDSDSDGLVDTHLGWYMDLYNTEDNNTEGLGERVVSDAVLRDDSVIFVTITPDEDPCTAGGSSWYMEVSANSGSRHSTPVIDVTGDGIVDSEDYLATDNYGTTVSSGRSDTDDYLMSAPVCIALGDGAETCYSNTSDATVTTIDRDAGVWYGRWMWREL